MAKKYCSEHQVWYDPSYERCPDCPKPLTQEQIDALNAHNDKVISSMFTCFWVVIIFLIIAFCVKWIYGKVKGFFSSSESTKTVSTEAAPKSATVMSMDYSVALRTNFPNGSLGENKRPIEVHFQSVSKNGDSYTINGYTKTKAAQDLFSGTLKVSSGVKGGSCGAGETELKGSYNLNEKESKTSGRFAGNFVACENSGNLSSANFSGKWIKHSNNNETPCSWSK